MKQSFLAILLLICIHSTAQYFHFNEIKDLTKQQQATYAKQLVLDLIKAFEAEDFVLLESHFSDSLWQKYDSTKVKISWNKTVNQNGAFQKVIDVKWVRRAEGDSYLVGLAFENGKRDLKLSFNADNKITAFRLMPYREAKVWQLPPYADITQFNIQEATIPAYLPLIAELTLPKAVENPPIMVLVHGSGPNDMDETLGPNKIFKDIAYGLASRGIGVLRYNKVSFDHQSEMLQRFNEVTIDLEVTNDAVAAIELAHLLTKGKVILIGHSLGGHLAPKIAEASNPDGVVVLAGNVSPLEDIVIDQFEYLMENDSSTQLTEFIFNSIKWQINNLKEGIYDSTTTGSTLPFALPAVYWLSLKDYAPTQLSQKQDIPYLILNGGRDYQVTTEEAEKWQNGNDHPHSKTIIYPQMNHLFYAREGLLLPAEYEEEAHLDEKVITDIEQWIKSIE
jgi:dienelactone hydrolase